MNIKHVVNGRCQVRKCECAKFAVKYVPDYFDTLTIEELRTECRSLTRAVQKLQLNRRRDELFVDAEPLTLARIHAGWDGLQLARALGVSRSAVSGWKRGDSRLARDRAIKIVELFRRHGKAPPRFPELNGHAVYTQEIE